jgi:hypothetical protein
VSPIVIEKYSECKCGHRRNVHEEVEVHEYYPHEGKCTKCDCKEFEYSTRVKVWSDGRIQKEVERQRNSVGGGAE